MKTDYICQLTNRIKNGELATKPLAKNSFGHSILMYFRENKLVAHVLINEIP